MKEIFIAAAVVDFQTNNHDDDALMGAHLIIRNGKQLSKEQIEQVMKKGFTAMNDLLEVMCGSETKTFNMKFNKN